MATIHSLTIKNFRGIDKFYQSFYQRSFICLIGRGDSGKSTILDAISYVLSSSWNITFYDNDFFKCDITNPIEIEATLTNLPDFFVQETLGLYIRGINKKGEIVDDFEQGESISKALTIKLTVKNDLEPIWTIENTRPNQDPISITASTRGKLNAFLISDYTDKHFSWSKGNPLYSLLKQEAEEDNEEKNIVINALRKAKKEIDNNSFIDFKEVIKRITKKSAELGVDVSQMTTSIDFKDISIKDNRVCLHDVESIPFRLKGKGLKRLISIAIQTTLSDNSGIVLIDEIEQGLEPDRVQHLVNSLKTNNKGQIFITTHSNNVVVELNAIDLFLLKKGATKLLNSDNSLQACIRGNPEALFANKLIICEGATEIGICRAINHYRISKGKMSIAYRGISLVDGTGSNFVEYCKRFRELEFPVCIFCDSDDPGINSQKDELKQLGATIVDCEANNCIEYQIFKDLPWNGVVELLRQQFEIKDFDSVRQSVENQYEGILPNNWENIDSPQIRDAIMKTAAFKKPKNNGGFIDKSWYKRIDQGEILGSIVCQNLDQMNSEIIKMQIEILSNWMN